MEIRIHELLNGYEDSSVPMEETRPKHSINRGIQ